MVVGSARKMDRYPQYITDSVVSSAANTWTQQTKPLPVNRVGSTSGNKTRILEIARVEFEVSDQTSTVDATGYRVYVTTKSHATEPNFADPSVIVQDGNIVWFTTSGSGLYQRQKRIECETSDGYGILVATDNLYVSLKTTNWTAAATLRYKIWYRFVDVSLQEYIGMVQAQS